MGAITERISRGWREWRPGSGATYLCTFLLFAILLWQLQEANNRDLEQVQRESRIAACEARNELRGQLRARGNFTAEVRDELRDYLTLRLQGDRSKIAEGVPALRQAVRELNELEVPTLTFERCADPG